MSTQDVDDVYREKKKNHCLGSDLIVHHVPRAQRQFQNSFHFTVRVVHGLAATYWGEGECSSLVLSSECFLFFNRCAWLCCVGWVIGLHLYLVLVFSFLVSHSWPWCSEPFILPFLPLFFLSDWAKSLACSSLLSCKCRTVRTLHQYKSVELFEETWFVWCPPT